MEQRIKSLSEVLKDFCKQYDVDIEIESSCVNLGGDRKIEFRVIRRS